MDLYVLLLMCKFFSGCNFYCSLYNFVRNCSKLPANRSFFFLITFVQDPTLRSRQFTSFNMNFYASLFIRLSQANSISSLSVTVSFNLDLPYFFHFKSPLNSPTRNSSSSRLLNRLFYPQYFHFFSLRDPHVDLL